MRTRYAVVLATLCSTGVAAAERYEGMCEASAAAALDDAHFVVASDDTNVLRIYKSGVAQPVGRLETETFVGFDKSDLEDATVVGDRVYWISSHSFNSAKPPEDKPKRKVLFATEIVRDGATPALKPVGKPFTKLRDPLVAAAGVAAAELNIEGLAATPEGALLIGLRAPLLHGKAIVISLENPAAVIEAGAAPKFGPAKSVDLGGRGIRSFERVGSGAAAYVIAAGPEKDGGSPGFALFTWDGVAEKATKLEIDLDGLRPEAVIRAPGGAGVRLLSDDGDDCSKADEHKDVAGRSFRVLDVALGK